MYVGMGFIALITEMVLCARSQESLLSVSARGVYVVFWNARCNDRGKPCPKTRETMTESLTHLAGIEPKPLVHKLITALSIELPKRLIASGCVRYGVMLLSAFLPTSGQYLPAV